MWILCLREYSPDDKTEGRNPGRPKKRSTINNSPLLYFITINCLEFHSTYMSISFLKMQDMREKLLPEERLLVVTEEPAVFLMKDVIDDAGLFSVNRRF